MSQKHTIAIDFDGVIHRYSEGWKDGEIYDTPVPGAFEAIQALQDKGAAVFIFSTRDPYQIADWMNRFAPDIECEVLPPDFGVFWNGKNRTPRHDASDRVVGITQRKLAATCYIDDKAIPFTGDWDAALNMVRFGLRGAPLEGDRLASVIQSATEAAIRQANVEALKAAQRERSVGANAALMGFSAAVQIMEQGGDIRSALDAYMGENERKIDGFSQLKLKPSDEQNQSQN